MSRLLIYVHGKGGSAEEAEHYQPLFPESDVIGFDYRSQTPWEAKNEFSCFYDAHAKGYDSVSLIANSIGAFLSMHALSEKNISQALFISPIVDMEKLITDLMMWSNVTEDALQSKKKFPRRSEKPYPGSICAMCEPIRSGGASPRVFCTAERIT